MLATKLVELAGTKGLMQQSFEIGLKPALDRMRAQGMPDELVESIHTESQNFFKENFEWDEIEPQIAKLYADAFTEAELRELLAFYETPTGSKAVSQMPMLMQQGMAMAMGRIQTKMPEFQKKVNALIQAYRAKTAKAGPASAGPGPAPNSQPQ